MTTQKGVWSVHAYMDSDVDVSMPRGHLLSERGGFRPVYNELPNPFHKSESSKPPLSKGGGWSPYITTLILVFFIQTRLGSE